MNVPSDFSIPLDRNYIDLETFQNPGLFRRASKRLTLSMTDKFVELSASDKKELMLAFYNCKGIQDKLSGYERRRYQDLTKDVRDTIVEGTWDFHLACSERFRVWKN